MGVKDTLRNAALVAAYFGIGMAVMMAFEDWTAPDAFYFLCMTVSTVGYGDLFPTKEGAQWFVCVWAVIGIVLIFSIVSNYATYVQDWVMWVETKAFALVGIEIIDVEKLSVEQYSPEMVNARLKYWKRHVLALAPVLLAFAFFVVAYANLSKLSFSEAFYFGVITATTIGYGDHNLVTRDGALKVIAAAYVVFFVVCFANCLGEVLAIRQRQRLRNGKIALPDLDDLETMLLEKIASQSPADAAAGVTVGVDEADYVVQTLLNGGLIDPQILLAIRRSYYWAARADVGEDEMNSRITERDLHGLRLKASLRPKTPPMSGRFKIGGGGAAPVYAEAERVDVDFGLWNEHYWAPKATAARDRGMKARLREHRAPDRRKTEAAKEESKSS